MKKIHAQTAKVLEDIIQENNQLLECNQPQYQPTVAEDVEKYPELKQKLLQAKKDIEEENYFTSDEMKEMIWNGQI